MLAISISESLSMGPEAWSEWREDAMAAHTDAMQSMQWEFIREQWEVAQQLAQTPVGENAETEGFGQLGFPGGPFGAGGLPGWDLQSEFDQQMQGFDQWSSSIAPKGPEKSKEPEPQKLTIGGAVGRAPLSSLASPLRVPLPEPLRSSLGDSKEAPKDPELLDEDLLALPPLRPPGLEALIEEPSTVGLPRLTQPSPTVAAAVTPRKPATVEPLGQGGLTSLNAPADAPQGITVQPAVLGGTLIEWGIDGFCSKLQSSGSRPMVSPPFSACGLPNLRLMVSVTAREPAKSARSRERKGAAKSAAALKRGPLQGALKLKADCLQGATVMTFNLCVGPSKSGPFTYDFSQQAVHGPDDFGVDWREQVDSSSGTLRVGVEILEVRK